MMSTKDKILSAVIAHIKEGDSLEQITISKIAAEAEIGKSTVYEHFNSKEDMVSETYSYLLNYYENILMSDIQKMDFKTAFIEQIEKILFVMKDAKIIMTAIMNFDQESFIHQGKQMEIQAAEIRDKMKDRFTSIFKLGIIEGIIEPKVPKPYTGHVVQALISGLLFQYTNEAIEIKENELYELIYEQAIEIVKKS
jgi:AcrR family transcriptional regulator